MGNMELETPGRAAAGLFTRLCCGSPCLSMQKKKAPAATPFMEQQTELFHLTHLVFLLFFFLLAILVQDHIHGLLRYLVILQILSNLTVLGVGFLLSG